MVPKGKTGVDDHRFGGGQEKIVIQNSYGEKLVGVLHEAGSNEIVIICHGFRSSKECIPMVNLAASLQKAGITAFCFDFAGNGESEGSFQYGNYRREVEDLRAVVQHFLEKGRVTAAIVGHSKGGNVRGGRALGATVSCSLSDQLVTGSSHPGNSLLAKMPGEGCVHCGASPPTPASSGSACRTGVGPSGGNVVLLYASKYADVYRVVNISGRFALETGIEGRLGKDFLQRIRRDGFINVYNRWGRFEYRVTEESLMDRLTTDVQTSCKSVDKACRVLTVHGSRDKIVPLNNAFEFAKLIPNHELRVIEGADHEYTTHQDELASVVVDFVSEDLIKNNNVKNQSTSAALLNSRPHSRL